MFVGSVADNVGEEIPQKIFHAKIIIDHQKVAEEAKAYQKIPVINTFLDENGKDIMQEQIDRNYNYIKADVARIIEVEMDRIKKDPELRKKLGIEDDEEEDKNK